MTDHLTTLRDHLRYAVTRFEAARLTYGHGSDNAWDEAVYLTLHTLNLHPALRELVQPHNGLILVSGPTGSGKSSTLAALIQELNQCEARHILTIESPIEYVFRPKSSFIRPPRPP